MRKYLFAASVLLASTIQAANVAVTAIVEHPALDSIRFGVLDALNKAGYKEGENLNLQYQNAQNNTATAGQIAKKFIGDKPDVIIAIATPSAQAVVANTKKIPVLFSGVTDPVAAQLVKSWNVGNGNVSGVSDALDLDVQIELIQKIVPNAKRIGMVYNPGEANSVVVVEAFKQILPKYNMTLVESPAPRSVDVSSAARNLIGKVDVIYTSTDNNVVSTFESLAKVANEAKIPLIASDTDSVSRGAIAALGVDYYQMGIQTGEIAIRILNGENPNDIAPQKSHNLRLILNQEAALKQGVTLSDALIKEAAEIVTTKSLGQSKK